MHHDDIDPEQAADALQELVAMADDLTDYLRWQHKARLELLGQGIDDGSPQDQATWRAQVCRDWMSQTDNDHA